MSASNVQHWVVDAFEEHTASIELDGGKMIQIPKSLLPRGTKQGDVLCVTIEIDAPATKRAVDASTEQVKRIRQNSAERDPGGDVNL
jgi:hypothetical protein